MNKRLIRRSSSKGIKFNARKLMVNFERYIYNTLTVNDTQKRNKIKHTHTHTQKRNNNSNNSKDKGEAKRKKITSSTEKGK